MFATVLLSLILVRALPRWLSILEAFQDKSSTRRHRRPLTEHV
jgi:hypothetical protein